MIEPLTTMEAAWAESDRLSAESGRKRAESAGVWCAEGFRLEALRDILRAESALVVILTAQKLYGVDVGVDWLNRTVQAKEA